MAASSLPARHQELDLHRRLVEDDPTAPGDLIVAYLDYLAHWLERHNRGAAEDFCNEAAEDALIGLTKNPLSYRPELLPLANFLRMSAQRDLQNHLQKEGRRQRDQISLNFVEHSQAERNSSNTDPGVILVLREETDRIETKIMPCVKKGLSEPETQALELFLGGEKKTASYAQILGIAGLPRGQQEVQVKRFKDKLKKRLERCRRGHDEAT